MTDDQLLISYVTEGDEQAFGQLVDRHLPLVYGLASREIYDFRLAEEITQNVFSALARTAHKRSLPDCVPAWIYGTTRKQIAQTMRSEMRRKRREEKAASATETTFEHPVGDAAWKQFLPDLNAALSQLALSDQTALFLRFYEELTLPELGRQLKITERAAQKRVQRAVERLRRLLGRRGVTLSSGMLGTGMFTAGAAPPPLSLSEKVKTLGAAPTPAPGLFNGISVRILASAAAVAGLVGLPLIWKHFQPSSPLENSPPSTANTSLLLPTSSPEHPMTRPETIEDIYRLASPLREERIARLLSQLHHPYPEPFLRELVAKWNQLDYKRLAQALVELYEIHADDAEYADLIGRFLAIPIARWIEENAEEARYWVRSLPRTTYAEAYAFEAVLQELPLEAAWSWLIQRPYNRDRAIEILLSKLSGSLDMMSALEWMGALPADPEHSGVRTKTANIPAHQPADRSRGMLWMHAVTHYARDHRHAVADWVTRLPASDAAAEALGTLAALWAEEAPHRAAAWALELTESDQTNAIHAVTRQWASSDPLACLTWTLNLQDEPHRWAATSDAFRIWLEHEAVHDEAAAWLASLNEITEAKSLFRDLSQTLSPSHAARWAHDLTPSPNRGIALEYSYYRLGQTKPSEGITLIQKLGHQDQIRAVEHLSLGWLISGAKEELRAWQETLRPNSDVFYASKSAEVELYAAAKPERAMAIIRSYPKSQARDRLVVKFAQRRTNQSSLQENARFLDEIVDPGTRSIVQRRLKESANQPPMTLPEIGNVPFAAQSLDQLRSRLDYLSQHSR